MRMKDVLCRYQKEADGLEYNAMAKVCALNLSLVLRK